MNPFSTVTSPVESFLEVPLVGCPGLSSVEIQRLSLGGFAAVVHTREGVDFYVDPALGLNREWFDTDPAFANLKRGQFSLVAVEVSSWTLDGDSIDVVASFALTDGRRVQVNINQRSAGETPGKQFIPTPVLEEPRVLRFLEVHGFGLLRRDAAIEIRVGDELLTPAKFPIPVGGKRRYSARYASSCRLVGLNPAGVFEPSSSVSGGSKDSQNAALTWKFEPALPEQLGVGHKSEGSVTFDMDIGHVAHADYLLAATRDGWSMELRKIRQDWRPPARDLQLWVLSFLRRRRRRNLGWTWSGRVEATADNAGQVSSHWAAQPERST